MIELTLYGRAGCHLCDDLKSELLSLAGLPEFKLTEVDIGWVGELVDKYGRSVPVLEMAGQEICHYFLDADRLRAALLAPADGSELI